MGAGQFSIFGAVEEKNCHGLSLIGRVTQMLSDV
jgi:hypothetical protein